ncbi:outer membrane transport energization protein ExbB [Sphingopyxis sp. YR583]|uniref:tonB-system energizer ExbB n=1 Tax=Sphingopyxis sp. YR583 TaxID=1881047 RepID=UPI0008A7BE3C|nr:tonB-system energizer ExbB [Sphingopyxis sp. YR583]SEH12966.1 outer membrane transport energization protein ExbB [Sphingopyxis sp. YR583]
MNMGLAGASAIGTMAMGGIARMQGGHSAGLARTAAAAALVAGGLLLAPAAMAAAPVAAPALVVPKNLTYWEMFAHATLVVKLVMMILLAASVVTWTIWIAKLLELKKGRAQLRADNEALGNATELKGLKVPAHAAPARMLAATQSELAKAGPLLTVEAAEGLKERVAARLLNVETSTIEKMLKGASVLATVGAITPFVGLFGTVWGIMNSFIGISQSNTTNLAVVAPGIAEALLATAMGLVAAIPAVIMYNHVARFIAGQRRLLSEASTNIACLLSHEVDRQLAGRTRGIAA